MRYKIFTVRDRAIDAYGQPFYATSVGGAVRSFSDEINRPAENNQLAKHPEDFDLYQLGEFTEQTGRLEVFEQPQFFEHLASLKKGLPNAKA